MSFLDGIEIIDNYEKSSNDDYVLLTLILVTLDHPNLNGAVFTKEEVLKAKATIIDTPLIVLPDVLGTPSSHSESFPRLDKEALIVGHHTASKIIQKDGKEHLQVTAKLYKSRYPELIASLQQLHLSGQLFCSMECSYSSEEQTKNGRILKGIKFIGNCLVNDPAGQYSTSLDWEAAKKEEEKLDWLQLASVETNNWLDGIENLN
ncbi:hypothetical protein [Bacillus sp. UMB0893]|uniref:hypothetical protein n=1 Tax=Bacillus sp. UMB0893 TaxID=2066053 RepID=UPI000C755E8F|nr:hypothetical protein [Bacillus sp. UMB0893]PLR69102.1 hypothetical protein CYJ36_01180 [Bacillus sp. UMB0893]